MANSNYTLTFVPGTLTISKAPLSVTADAKSKTYGAADPGFTVSYLGFVNSETPAVLGGTLALAADHATNSGNVSVAGGSTISVPVSGKTLTLGPDGKPIDKVVD